MPEFHAEAPQAAASEGLAQGPYMAARAGCIYASCVTHRPILDALAFQFDYCSVLPTLPFKFYS